LEARDLQRDISELRQQLRRNQVYLTAALAVIGLGTLVSVGLVGFYGLRLGEQVWEVRTDIDTMDAESRTRTQALSLEIGRQQQELAAIRKAANDDLVAIQEAHRKIASIGDRRRELAALREANEALWSELASQRADILEALDENPPPAPVSRPEEPEANNTRFRLGETAYYDPRYQPGELKGFIQGDEDVHRASTLPGNPAHLLIELSPREVQLGQPYELAIRLVNRSNETLDANGLRLDWSFGGKNTGGAVPLGVLRIDPKGSAVVYEMSGQWTPAHEDGPVVVTATLTLGGGEQLANSLEW
jgi:hypothetical protein